ALLPLHRELVVPVEGCQNLVVAHAHSVVSRGGPGSTAVVPYRREGIRGGPVVVLTRDNL
ncbi:MAG: hypothetical protein ACJ79M_12920, partial [Myxococcales bacterium]